MSDACRCGEKRETQRGCLCTPTTSSGQGGWGQVAIMDEVPSPPPQGVDYPEELGLRLPPTC